MSRSIEERIVSMAFENAKFEAGIAQTMASLSKLDASLKQIGKQNALGEIDKAASKVTLQQPMSALDKLKTKFSRSGNDAAQGMSEIERAGSKVTLEQPARALDNLSKKTAQVGAGAADSFSQIEGASHRVSLMGLNSALDSVTAKFSVLQGAASVALGNITSQAMMRGFSFAKGFGIGPVVDGLHEYETNLKSIQTIQANTDRPLTEINASLEELNRYSDQTIYNFSEMAKNIGTFTAAGVDLKTATSSIKGIANMAALSGSSSQQAATAMYQLSQAISSGRVGLQDWNSVVNAGMAGKKLQSALATTGIAMGKLESDSLKLVGPMKTLKINGQSFRESIMTKPGGPPSWLSSDILVNTLATLDGRFSQAALSAEKTKDGLVKYTKAQVEAKIADNRAALEKKSGVKYTDEQFKALMKLSDSAFKSATEVKTLGQVFDVAKETIGSGWAASFQSIFGTLTEAKKTFTAMSGAINGFINANALARNTVLHDWKELGGRTALIDGIKQAFKDLFAILKPIGQAFRDIFPRKTGKDLFEMTKSFAAFTKRLQPSEAAIEGIRRTFRGLFAVLHIGWGVVKGVASVIGDLLGVVGHGSGGFLNFTGSIADFVVALDDALTRGGLLEGFFDNISDVLKVPLQLLLGVSQAIFSLFGGMDDSGADKVAGGLNKVGEAVGPLEQGLTGLKRAWDNLVDMFREAKDLVSPWLEKIGEQLSKFGSLLANAIQTADFDDVMSFLQTGFIGGIFLALKKGIGEFGGIKAMFEPLNNVFGALTGNLEAMQNKVKAETIKSIAIAIGILAASIWVISKIDSEDLAKSMTAISVGFGQLVAAMAILGAVMKGQGKLALATMPIVAASMVGLATSLVILAGAMKIFGTMSWDELAKGLVGVGGGLAAIGVGMKFLGPMTLVQGPAILVLAIGLNALALAVKQFASLSWEEMGRGLAGVLGVLVALISPVSVLGPGLLITGPGLIAAAFGMNMLAGALRRFSEIDPGKMAIGIGGMIGVLATLGVAIGFMPPLMIAQAGALILMGVALSGIAGALKVMGGIGIEKLIVGLAGMAGALAILAIGLTAMSTAGPGALALLGAAAAFAVLGPAMALLGSMNILTVVKALGAMAAVMAVLALAGMYAAPGLSALGFALLPLAGVFALTAASAFIFAKALQLLGGEGKKGIGVMVAALTAFALVLPKLVIETVKGFVETLGMIAELSPKIAAAIFKIVTQLIEVVIKLAPRWALAIGALITSFVTILAQNAPKIIAAGWKLILDFLTGIDQNIGQVVTRVASIVTQFINGLTEQMPRLAAAGSAFLIAFLTGIATHIGRIVGAGIRLVTSFLGGIAQNIGKVYAAGVRVILSVLNGIAEAVPRLIAKGVEIAGRFVRAVANGLVRLASVGADAIIRFLNGLADVIREKGPELRKAGWNLADAIVDGMIAGFKELKDKVKHVVGDVVGVLPDWAEKKLGIKSPSRVFAEIGRNTMLGLAQGLNDSAPGRVMADQADSLIKTAQGAMSGIPSALEGIVDADPVISPVLDLSSVEKEAKKLGDMTNVAPITADVSMGHASTISEEQATAEAARADAPVEVIKEIKLEQNNHSPEALSDVEIYRRTKNLLSLAKDELGLATA